MSMLGDLLEALPKPKPSPVSLLDALPDPNVPTTVTDYESKPSLLESDAIAMSAAEQFAVLMHKKEDVDERPNKRPNKKRSAASEAPMPNKKRERRVRGGQIKARSRGNQRKKQ